MTKRTVYMLARMNGEKGSWRPAWPGCVPVVSLPTKGKYHETANDIASKPMTKNS